MTVVRPGDTVLMTVDVDMPPERATAISSALEKKLPGCTVVILAGLRVVDVYRPDPSEET